MSIADMKLNEQSLLFAKLSRDAYLDDNRKIFYDLGFPTYKFLDNDGAQGHIAASETEIIITCRGTEPTKLNDLLADLNTIPKRHGIGWVHEGFRIEARKLYPMALEFVKANPNKKIWVTGHSLGAAMSLYITQELEYLGYKYITLFNYGQPRLGNKDYVDSIKSVHYRFVNCNDFVTHVPPAAMMFKHHGELCYINFYGYVRQLSAWQRFKDMWRAHKRAWAKGQLFDGLMDHSMDNYVAKLQKIVDEDQPIN